MKRPFLLIEVLVAIAIVSLCLLPLLRPHFGLRAQKAKDLQALHHQLAADRLFEQIRLQFYTHEIDWHDLNHGNKTIKTDRYTIRVVDHYRKSNRADYRLNEITIDDEFVYYLFTERHRRGMRQT